MEQALKTKKQFKGASYYALLLVHNYLQDYGFKTKTFYDADENFVVSVTVEDEGEEVEYTATFERV